ncbi:pknB, partial [Symbiodinium necroappetens]
ASTCSPGVLTKSASTCSQCFCEAASLFLDPSDLNRYCESCWIEYYGHPPSRSELALVPVEVSEPLAEEVLAEAWSEQILPGWPPPFVSGRVLPDDGPETWTFVRMRLRRDICGGHAREQLSSFGLATGEVLAQRYQVEHPVGEGHFTKAFQARDLKEGRQVCVKRHRNLPIEALSDLYVIGQRLQEVDPGGSFFPMLVDAFYDSVGYTVESMLEGRNCLALSTEPSFFQDLGKLRLVAFGALSGLVMLDKAGVVHNDIKPDNLIWTEVHGSGPRVKIVDFGCARLDHRHESGRNWALAEGGAGHLGKWAPEMTLRLAIGHRADVWGTAVSLCELLCGRTVWRSEMDTAEVVMTQALGLCNLRDGVPPSLLRRSPLDVRQLYTPAPRHWPLRRNASGQMETLRSAVSYTAGKRVIGTVKSLYKIPIPRE